MSRRRKVACVFGPSPCSAPTSRAADGLFELIRRFGLVSSFTSPNIVVFNEVDDLQRMVDLQVDGINTDHSDLLLDLMTSD